MIVVPLLVARDPPPAPMSRVLFGKVMPLLMTMVPGGSKIVDGGGVVTPLHGLMEQVWVVPGLTPRASITAPAGVRIRA